MRSVLFFLTVIVLTVASKARFTYQFGNTLRKE